MHLAQESAATNHRTHLASWAPIFCAWYPDAKAARLAQGIFLLMEPYEDNKFPSQIQEPQPPIQIEGEDEYKLDEIIDSQFHYNKLQYRAKWKGYSPEHDKV